MIPDISVVIPIYNAEPYIAECLDSALNQTHENIEIICVDDLGSDNSMQIVEKYAQKDRRIKILRHEVNKGQGISRNTGLARARGKYLFFLDSDDYMAPGILEKLLEKIKITSSDLVISKTVSFLEDPDDKWLIERKQAVDSYLGFEEQEKYAAEDILEAISKISSPAWGKLYVLEFLKSNGIGFAEANIIHEDDGFNIKILVNKPVVSWVRDTGVMYRLRKNSLTGEVEQASERHTKIGNIRASLNDAFDYIKKRFPAEDAKRLIQGIKCSNLYGRYFERKINIPGVLRVRWSPSLKQIRFLGLTVFRKAKEPKISVIVPFYNTIENTGTEKYLKQNIESLLSQDYENFEILYIDNNSTDASRAFIESCKKGRESRLKLFTQTQKGVSNARNMGIENASGEYFTFVDSDDFVSRDYLKKAAKHLGNAPDVLIGFFTLRRGKKERSDTWRKRAIRKYGKKAENIYASIECSPNIFFRTSFINDHNIRQENRILIGEDNLFNASAILKGKRIQFYNSHGYFYQVLENSSSNVKSDKFLTFIEAYDKIFSMAEETYGFVNENALWYFKAKCRDFEGLCQNQELFNRAASEMIKRHRMGASTDLNVRPSRPFKSRWLYWRKSKLMSICGGKK